MTLKDELERLVKVTKLLGETPKKREEDKKKMSGVLGTLEEIRIISES